MAKKKRQKRDVSQLMARLGAAEDEFLRREFLAPAVSGGRVRVRIAGAVCELRIQPADYVGWGIFQPRTHNEAVLVRDASLSERRDYLALFPVVRLIACRRGGRRWLAAAASFGDSRFRLKGLAPILLEESLQLFDCVRVRYDGANFWFDEIDPRHSAANGVYLRAALEERTPPEELSRPGLTAEERAAYEVNYWHLMRPATPPGTVAATEIPLDPRDDANEDDIVRRRLRDSLTQAAAQLVDYLERADGLTVTYFVDGRRFTSSVDKLDLTVQVAGICLSDQDEKFDLNSLVGVLREGSRTHSIYEFDE